MKLNRIDPDMEIWSFGVDGTLKQYIQPLQQLAFKVAIKIVANYIKAI
jgi:hypothetical protein